MSEGRYDKAKGRVKQAAGDLTDNDELRREGKRDETGGKVKVSAERAKDKVAEGVDRVKDKLNR